MFSGFQENKILNMAHRGARSLAPENTLVAARKAFDLGADGWELDVRLSADGEPIVFHDATLDRTSDAREAFPRKSPWRTEAFTLAELRLLDVGSWFEAADPFGEVAAGGVSPDEIRGYTGEKIPTLREALALTRDRGRLVNVEVKEIHGGWTARSHLIKRVVELIEALDMLDQALLSSFCLPSLQEARALNADLALGVLVRSLPVEGPEALVRGLCAQAYHPRVDLVRPEEIRRLKDRGVETLVWTVNEEPTMRQLIRAGVRGLFTDYPQRAAAVLLEAAGGHS